MSEECFQKVCFFQKFHRGTLRVIENGQPGAAHSDQGMLENRAEALGASR